MIKREDSTQMLKGILGLLQFLVVAALAAYALPFSEYLEPVLFLVADTLLPCLNHPTWALMIGAVVSTLVVTVLCLRPRSVYLVDFATFKPTGEWKSKKEEWKRGFRRSDLYDEDTIAFMDRVLDGSTIGEESAVVPWAKEGGCPDTFENARREAFHVMTTSTDELFRNTGLTPQDIDLLVVSCSTFVPTPSLSSMMINHYKMKPTTRNYNLGGMGCSAGVVAVDLARDLLQVHKNSRCLVIVTENITCNLYKGNEKSKLVSNVIFRAGGTSILMTNRFADRFLAKYQLLHTVRVNEARNDEAYRSIYQEEDKKGIVGFELSKDLPKVATKALTRNLTILGPSILPYSEQFRYFVSLVKRNSLFMDTKLYDCNFCKAVEHFCIHAGGKTVISGIAKALRVPDDQAEPSHATFRRFGNTSASTVFYELSHLEGHGRIKKGDRVLQIALGAGFKCNTAVWRALQTVDPYPWDVAVDPSP